MKKEIRGLASNALKHLMVYEWPGNVRDLMNLLERTVALAPGDLLITNLLFFGKKDSSPL